MKLKVSLFGILMFSILVISTYAQQDDFPFLKGPYLGQKPPGLEPQLFLPGLISTHYVDHCIAFLDEGRVCVFAIWERGTSYMYEKGGRWTRPQNAPWQNEQGTTDFTAGPDDRTIFFQSSRPTSKNDEKQETNIWTVEWTGKDWTEPVLLPEPANRKDYSEIYPSAAPDGTLYFFSRLRPGSRPGDMGDVFFTRFIEKGGYLEAERLEDPINSYYYEVDPCVAPDGGYLLFGSGRPGGYSQLDLFICFRRDDGTWTHTVNAGPTLNPFCIPTRMSITPDGKYFFFPSRQPTAVPKGEAVESSNVERWGDYDVYWISTDLFKDLREQYVNKMPAADEIRKAYRNTGLSQAQALLSELHSRKKSDYYFEPSELLVFCGEMIAKNQFHQADRLYESLLSVFPGDWRILFGYSIACIMNGRTGYGLELMKESWSRIPDSKSEELFIVTFQLRIKSQKDAELEVLKFVTDEFPGSHYAFYNLADAYRHYGERDNAIEACQKALVLKPDFDEAAALLKKLERDKADEKKE